MHAKYVFRGREITLGKATKGVAIVLAVLCLIFVLNKVFRENSQYHHESQTALLKTQRDTMQGVEKLVKHLLEERLGQIMKFLEDRRDEERHLLILHQQDILEMLDNDRLKYLQAIPPPPPPPPPPSTLPLPPTCAGSQPLVIPILDYQLFHASQPTDRILRPFSERHVLVTPGSFFKHQLIHETLEDELLSFQRIQEDEKAFFAFNSQSSFGQGDVLSYLKNATEESQIMGLFKEVFRETRKDTKLMRTDPIVLDVGANLGYYSLFSAAFGFPVLAFEPKVHCHLFLKTSAVLSGIEDKITLVSSLVGDDPLAEMEVEQRTGCFPAETWDRKSKVKGKTRKPTTKVGQVGIDELLEVLYTKQGRDIPHIPLLRIDAEGFEFHVLRSAKKLLASKKVKNLLVELNSVAYTHSKTTPKDAKDIFFWLYDVGYRMQCMDDNDNEYFTSKNPQTKEQLAERAASLADPYTTDCWFYLE